MKIIFLTGGAGFIGSNFLNTMVPKNPKIFFVNIDTITSAGNLQRLQKIAHLPNYFFEHADICNFDALQKIFEKYHPTDIIHFAAETHVDISIKNPHIFTKTNIIWTQNLLDLHREFGMQRFHFISTDEVYGDNPEWWFFSENSPLRPSNPYSASKAAADMLVSAYIRTFWINATITRSSNNYGPHQNSISLIPLFIKNILENKKLPIYGDGSQIRDWLFVEDHIEAIWQVFTQAKNGSVYNIGGQNELTNLQITKILLQQLQASEDLISFVADRPGHDKRYALDISKIQKELGWSPKIWFEDGILRTIDFYKNYEF